MWWSARAKQAANKEHSRNFEAGRVEVTERALHRTGLRGRKIFIYGFVLLLLFIVTLGNLVVRWRYCWSRVARHDSFEDNLLSHQQ